jgi:hypothetical protein
MATMLEILSDEVVIQFFEYLDAYQLFRAFFSLNSRFNRLLKDPLLYLKFNSKYVRSIDAIDVEMWHTIVSHLTAITLIHDRHIRIFMSVCREIDFMCLQSLTLRRVYIGKSKKISRLFDKSFFDYRQRISCKIHFKFKIIKKFTCSSN